VDLVSSLPTFVVAVVLISALPGPAMALILRRAAVRGLRAAIPTVLGLEVGLYVWALLAAAGFAALVAASELAYLVLRAAGAAVLIVLGHAAWRGAPKADEPRCPTHPSSPAGWWGSFTEGLLVMLANPKAAVFMGVFYPQFVPPGRPLFTTTAVLAVLQVALERVFYLTLVTAVARAGAWLRKPRIRRWLEAVTGTVLIGSGVRVAISQ
jgi:threonine/homoserine/homoserine lactone efflux protein